LDTIGIGQDVAEEENKVIGYIVVGTDNGRSQIYGFLWGHIVSLAVDPEHHGHGVGSELISAGLKWLKDKGVKYAEVLTDQSELPPHKCGSFLLQRRAKLDEIKLNSPLCKRQFGLFQPYYVTF
jgi:GNAT superfamily N-acetyltransferase